MPQRQNLAATVEYDGTRFAGFQLQPRHITIQGEIERTLERITQEPTRVTGAGRTDAGVHALAQVISFSTSWEKPLWALQRGLNALLPKEIAIRKMLQVAPEFNARKTAVRRHYRYTILNRETRAPLSALYAYHWPEPLDGEAMRRAMECLLGVQDFASFGRTKPGASTIREVFGVKCTKEGDFIHIHVVANAFLKQMMRSMVGTLMLVGQGKLDSRGFKEILEAKDRSLAGKVVPAQGLCLMKIDYPKEYEALLSEER